MPALLASVEMFAQQHGADISVRSAKGHDRYLFIYQSSCHFSGASFKDGATNAPVLLTQVIDGFQPLWDKYQAIWQAAKPERP